MKKIKYVTAALVSSMMLALAACGNRTAAESESTAAAEQTEDAVTAATENAGENGQFPGDGQTPPGMEEGQIPSEMQPGQTPPDMQNGQMPQGGGMPGEYATVTEDDLIAEDDLFTDRDMSDEYEADTVITLKDGSITVSGDGAEADGNTVTITKAGVYEFTGSLTDGQIIVDAEDTDKVQIVLNGVTVTNSDAAAIYVLQADKVFITTVEGTVNSLTLTGAITQTDDNNVDGVIFSKDDICINGEGTLNIVSETCHGIVSKDDLKITSGTVNVTSLKKSLQANDSIRIGGGTVNLVSEKSEGMESSFIYIADGTVNIDSADDGLNCNDSAGALVIYGGTVNITAEGDGLDSNGSIYQYGGDITVSGPVNAGNGSMDYVGEAVISGGSAMIAGSSGMAMNYSAGSDQCSILYTFSSALQAGTEVTLTDESGDVIASFTPDTQFQTVVISCDDIDAEGTYTITAGSQTATVQMNGSTIYGTGQGMGFGGMGPGRMDGFGENGQGNTVEGQFGSEGSRPEGMPGGHSHGTGSTEGQENKQTDGV